MIIQKSEATMAGCTYILMNDTCKAIQTAL